MPDTFTEILVPTDGSNAVRPAVEIALDMARTYDATLHVLFVVEPPASIGGAGEGFAGLDSLMEELEETGQHATGGIAERATESGIETKTAVRRGNPRDDILAYATERGVDLIVMGTHGRTGVERALLGSVTETVIRHSEIPVLTVRRDPDE